MPHVIIYVPFLKIHESKTHLITQDSSVIQSLGRKSKSTVPTFLSGASPNDIIVDQSPIVVMDYLQTIWYNLVTSSSFGDLEQRGGGSTYNHTAFFTWTLKKWNSFIEKLNIWKHSFILTFRLSSNCFKIHIIIWIEFFVVWIAKI